MFDIGVKYQFFLKLLTVFRFLDFLKSLGVDFFVFSPEFRRVHLSLIIQIHLRLSTIRRNFLAKKEKTNSRLNNSKVLGRLVDKERAYFSMSLLDPILC